jgi:excisionase family DNA binding protein
VGFELVTAGSDERDRVDRRQPGPELGERVKRGAEIGLCGIGQVAAHELVGELVRLHSAAGRLAREKLVCVGLQMNRARPSRHDASVRRTSGPLRRPLATPLAAHAIPGHIAPGVDGPLRRLSYMSPRQSKPARAEQLVLDTPTPAVSLNEPLLSPAEAAGLLSVRVSWIYDAARCGRLPCVRIGRHVRFLRSDLERWVAEQRR